MERADLTRFRKGADVKKVERVLSYTMDGILTQQMRTGAFRPDLYFEEIKEYLAMMKKFFYT